MAPRIAERNGRIGGTRTGSPRTAPSTAGGPSEDLGAEGSISSERHASFTAPGVSDEDGRAVVEILQHRLFALIDLGLTLKHIHWNVVGPSFVGVHEMLDPQYAGVQAMVDTLAERTATMGGVPSGLPGRLVSQRTWDDYDLGRADTQAHLGALDLVYRGVVADHRRAIEAVGDLDPVTEDILIGQTGILEQFHWFVRSHLEDWAGGLVNAGAETEVEAARNAVRRTGVAASRPSGRSRESAAQGTGRQNPGRSNRTTASGGGRARQG